MYAGFVVALLAGSYLVYGILSGSLSDFGHLARGDQQRVLANLHLATQGLRLGLVVGSVAAAYALWGEEYTGYGMVVGGLILGLGAPQLIGLTGSPRGMSDAYRDALGAFPAAMVGPLVVGGLLVAYDVVVRLIRAFQDKPVRAERLTYGQTAAKDSSVGGSSARQVPLGQCWQGPYCRDFLRPQCPIFIAKKACWREKRGCYCEPDIVSAVADRVSGVHLDMAPEPTLNLANAPIPSHTPRIAFDPLSGSAAPMHQMGGVPAFAGRAGSGVVPAPPRKVELTAGQKRERCRNCVIYNEHQREKYRFLVPVTIVGTIIACIMLSTPIRAGIGVALMSFDTLVNRLSFLPGSEKIVHIGQPSETIEWVLLAAFALMVLAKVLQVVEWALFKIKI